MKNRKLLLALALAAVLLFGLVAIKAGWISPPADVQLSSTNDGSSASTDPAQDPPVSDPDTDAVTEPTDPVTEPAVDPVTEPGTEPGETLLDEDGWYNSKDEVALYIHQYGKLPSNYITKKEAEALGWSGGSLEPYAPGKSIGGSYFGNYEELLPKAKGRSYTECDIDTAGKNSRGAKRIVFSNDGYIYYTGDHYETFELLYSPGD